MFQSNMIDLEDTIKNTLKLKLRMDLHFGTLPSFDIFRVKTFNPFCKTLKCCLLSL